MKFESISIYKKKYIFIKKFYFEDFFHIYFKNHSQDCQDNPLL
jgi:hypothetical protein